MSASAKKHSSVVRGLAELPILAVIALTVAFVLKTFVAQAFYIPSRSMEPQLHVGDRVIVSKLAYQFHDPNRGDIVVFPSPNQRGGGDDGTLPGRVFRGILEGVGLGKPDETILIKRVIALPGETVEGREGRVYINGRLLVEPYLPAEVRTEDFGPATIPEGQLWVMGDNRLDSSDSHVFGPITQESVIGRAIAKVWPVGEPSFL